MVDKVMWKWWWWLMKKQSSLSSLNTLGDSNHHSSNHIYNGDQDGLGCQIGEVVDVEDDLAAMMSGGVLDVDTKMV